MSGLVGVNCAGCGQHTHSVRHWRFVSDDRWLCEKCKVDADRIATALARDKIAGLRSDTVTPEVGL